jgi:hypothetical protein
METLVWLAIAVLALFAAAAWLAISSRNDRWGRPAAMLLFLLGAPAIAAAGLQVLGHHRPMALAWELTAGDHRVLAVKMVQDEAIYLYLDAGRSEPWPVLLPWSNEAANRIQKLQDEASPESLGQFIFSYEPSLDVHRPQFHPLPQPRLLPPKPVPDRAPHLEQSA